MQCLDFMDDHCGGTADRLKPFVLLLREAHKSKRLLFIHWNRPARLEEFLVPPRGGLDWRAPPFLVTLVSSLDTLFSGCFELYSSLTHFISYSILLLRCSFMIRRLVNDQSIIMGLYKYFPQRNRFSEVDSNPSLEEPNSMTRNLVLARLTKYIMTFGGYFSPRPCLSAKSWNIISTRWNSSLANMRRLIFGPCMVVTA